MKHVKNVPLALFALFCLKALVTGTTLETVACLAALGTISFLYETFIQNEKMNTFQTELLEMKKQDEHLRKELEQIKAYVSSLKLNTIRGGASGLNRTAQ